MKKNLGTISCIIILGINVKAKDLILKNSNILAKNIIVHPGEMINLEQVSNARITYQDLYEAIKKYGEYNEYGKNKRLSLQDEKNKIDLSFLDDLSILVSLNLKSGAPPNAL